MSRLIDSLPDPTEAKPMKVIVAGLPRTGTISLYVALQALGYTSYHFLKDELEDSHRNAYWLEALQCRYLKKAHPYGRQEFKRLLGQYDACLDLPGSMFWDDLFQAYPDAKVILTTRDADSWFRSMHKTIFPYFDSTFVYIVGYLGCDRRRRDIAINSICIQVLCGTDRESGCRKGFSEHNERVRKAIPKNQFYEHRIGDGWSGLCRFLDVPIPNRPYPHANNSEELMKAEKTLLWRDIRGMTKKWIPLLASVFAVGLVLWIYHVSGA